MKILMTGSTGRLGSHLTKLLDNIHISELKEQEVNIGNYYFVENFFKNNHDFDLVVHLAAYTAVDKAEAERVSCYNTNVIGTQNLIDVVSHYNLHFLYMSTDYVFDGTKGNYNEEDYPNPVNYYGLTKLLGEIIVRRYRFKNIVIRTSFKPDEWQYPSAFDDIYTSADYISVISKEIEFLIRNFYSCLREEENIYHIGTEKKTMLELAKRKNPHVNGISKNDVSFKIPNDLSLDISKWKKFKAALTPKYSCES